MGSARCTRGTGAAARRSSPCRSGGRSRRSPSPGRASMTCHFPPGAWPSWRSSSSLRGWTGDISHEGLRVLLREEGVTFQRLKTWKTSKDPDYAVKKGRVEHLYAVAEGEVIPDAGEPEVIFCMDEFGPLNLQPRARPAMGRGQREERRARPRTTAPDARDLHPHRRRPAPARRLRPAGGQAVRAHQAPQDPDPVPKLQESTNGKCPHFQGIATGPSRTRIQRSAAFPHPPSTPPHDGQHSPPDSSCRSTTSRSPFTVSTTPPRVTRGPPVSGLKRRNGRAAPMPT